MYSKVSEFCISKQPVSDRHQIQMDWLFHHVYTRDHTLSDLARTFNCIIVWAGLAGSGFTSSIIRNTQKGIWFPKERTNTLHLSGPNPITDQVILYRRGQRASEVSLYYSMSEFQHVQKPPGSEPYDPTKSKHEPKCYSSLI